VSKVGHFGVEKIGNAWRTACGLLLVEAAGFRIFRCYYEHVDCKRCLASGAFVRHQVMADVAEAFG